MRIAYIDHSFHEKTKSTLFLQELLSQHHIMTNYWDDSWQGGLSVPIQDINDGKYDLIIFFQHIPYFKEIRKIQCKNIVWIPMYDGDRKRNIFEWLSYLICNVKIMSFSDNLNQKTKTMGFDTINVKYYPQPKFIKKESAIIKIFFWQRVKTINWPLIKTLIKGNKIEKVIIRTAMDGNETSSKPTHEDIKKFNIEIIQGWLEKDKYDELLKEADLFIAPRPYEGIGMSFLESMSLGIPVIAPNHPTMNEYIQNGKNGFLYDLKKPKSINLSTLSQIKINLRKDMVNGFSHWQKQQTEILHFIEKQAKIKNKSTHIAVSILVFLYYLIERPCRLIIKKISGEKKAFRIS